MWISDLSSQNLGDRRRIEAQVAYEDTDLPPIRLFYEVGPPLSDALEPTPEAFVLPAFPIALWVGERRLAVEGALDSTLASGLGQAASLLADWYQNCGSMALEPSRGFHALKPRSQPRTVALFGGGVDAMAMLCDNRRLVPLDHPNAIRTVLYCYGASNDDRPDGLEDPRRRTRYEVLARRFEALGERVGFTLVRADSNVIRLDPRSRWPFYHAGHSAALLAPLVASPGYVTDAVIASDGEGGRVQTPHGSHPLLDVLYSSGAVRVHHVHPQRTRTDKLGLLSDWEPAYDTLQVCHGNPDLPPEPENCGICEKCVRTMVGLTAWEALSRFTVFPRNDVTPEMIDAIRIRYAHTYLTQADLLERLERVGRHDLLRAIHGQLERVNEGRWARGKRKWRRSVMKRVKRLRGRLPNRR